MLYIGHDKETVDHLNKIGVCHTYWVKTKGLIHHDLDRISSHYFDYHERQDDENQQAQQK